MQLLDDYILHLVDSIQISEKTHSCNWEYYNLSLIQRIKAYSQKFPKARLPFYRCTCKMYLHGHLSRLSLKYFSNRSEDKIEYSGACS